MFKLVQNEWMKIFKRTGTYVMIGLLLFVIILVGTITKFQQGSMDKGAQDSNWKTNVEEQIEGLKQDQERLHENNPTYKAFERDIAKLEYRLEHNIPTNQEYSVWNFVEDATPVIQFAGLFVIIIAAGIVASEFNWGTIKLLLIRPINRGKILISKYLAIISFAILMIALSFIFAMITGFFLFGAPDTTIPYLGYSDGVVTEQNIVVHLIVFFALSSINMLMLATMAFMISAVFRNNSLAIGLSIFLMFVGGEITALIAAKYEWAKYILFANTELTQYFEGTPMVEGMTWTFSVIMLIIYFILFQFFAHYVFYKRDVAG